MRITPSGAFRRDLRRLDRSVAEDVIQALELFCSDHKAKALNFETVRSRKGYFTIRANYSVRILLRLTAPSEFDVVAVGNHDYIYASYFRK